MDHNASIIAVSSVIQLALAPIFLFTGIAAFLSMLSLRLGRAIDRGRSLDRRIPLIEDEAARHGLRLEAAVVWQRMRYINWSIRFAVVSALLLSFVVVSLFIADLSGLELGLLVAWLFVAVMSFLVLSLVLLLMEVTLSTKTMRQGLEHLFVGAED